MASGLYKRASIIPRASLSEQLKEENEWDNPGVWKMAVKTVCLCVI